jgi:hypothetical protein
MVRLGPKVAHRRWLPVVFVSLGAECWRGTLTHQNVHFWVCLGKNSL